MATVPLRPRNAEEEPTGRNKSEAIPYIRHGQPERCHLEGKAMTEPGGGSATSDSFEQLGNRRHISVRTFRKNGSAVATPVWFVADDGTLLVMTSSRSGKVKRIANDPNVEVAASDMRGRQKGPWLAGEARLVADPDRIGVAVRGLKRKYGFLFWLFSRLNGQPLGYGDAIVEIRPKV